MKSDCSRYIQIEIDVVHLIDTPLGRDLVCQHVPHIEGVIEENEHNGAVPWAPEGRRKRHGPPAMPFDEGRHPLGNRLFQDDQREGGQGSHGTASRTMP